MQTLYLGAYGAASMKPLKVWANTALVGHLGVTMADARERLPEELIGACMCCMLVELMCVQPVYGQPYIYIYMYIYIYIHTCNVMS